MMRLSSEQLAWMIRRHGVEMTHLSGGSHIGAILSVADIVAVLYANVLRYDAANPYWIERDRMILGKGHAGAAIYSALAESGFFSVEEIKTHCQNGSRLSGHVSHYVPGVELSTGSLGHGLSVAVGMAYAAKKDHRKHRIYVIMGDGECDEGAVWEAALVANHFCLNNLTAIIDHNRMQSMDFCENTLELESLMDKWKAFGWGVAEINGNSHEALRRVLNAPLASQKPRMIIADTIKGYGVPYMQNNILWHYRFPHEGWEYDQAVKALHEKKPFGIADSYTPDGILNPAPIPPDADIYGDHTMSTTWHPTWMNSNANVSIMNEIGVFL